MKKHLKYLRYVIVHKWFVFLECLKYGLVWRGIIHDWHKFLPSEWFPYVEFFYGSNWIKKVRDETGYYKPDNTGYPSFDKAWFLHQKRAYHHWQSWVKPLSDGTMELLVMPESDLLEMICDWRGAGRAQRIPNTLAWYKANKDKLFFHPWTRKMVEREIGYKI